MSEGFNSQYLALLRKQVEEEIQFLVSNGHNQHEIYMPCMFCIKSKENYYTCHRLSELKQFLSSIVMHSSNKLTAQHPRRSIGVEADTHNFLDSVNFSTQDKLPLLSITL